MTPDGAVTRSARRDDAFALAELLAALGYPSSVTQVGQRIAASAASADAEVFVAEVSGRVVGLLSFHCILLFHADGALGRITSLVVAADYRRRGFGRFLVAAAEDFAWAHGCVRVEITSGDHRPDTHAFYEHLGYRSDCRRFIKQGRNSVQRRGSQRSDDSPAESEPANP